MNEEVIVNLGLSKNEAKVYLSLLSLGSATGGQISEASKIHRTNVYDALERLHEKGLVAYIIKDTVKYFEATDPENLSNLLKEKENQLNAIMPQLKLHKKLSQSKSEVFIYEGIKAFMDILYKFLDFKDDILVFGLPRVAPEMVKYVIPHYHKTRVEKKVLMKHIYNFDAKERIAYLRTLPYTEAKALPQKFDAQVSTFICGEHTMFMMWIENPKIIYIKDKAIANSYKNYFEILWKQAK